MCKCDFTWTAHVGEGKHTKNLPSEPTLWCPKCHDKALSSSAVFSITEASEVMIEQYCGVNACGECPISEICGLYNIIFGGEL